MRLLGSRQANKTFRGLACWLTLKQEHNRRCLQLLEPLIRDDKRALKWLRREAERGIGQASPVPGVGLHIDWD